MRSALLCGGLVLAIAGVAVAADAPAAAPAAQKTCGQMTAELAVLPAKMNELMTGVADAAEAHAAFMLSTNKTKESTAEANGLKKMAKDHRDLAKQFAKTAENMKSAEKWAAADHDMAKMMADPKITEAMKKQYQLEKEMVALMQKHIAQMEAMMPKGTN